MARQSLMTHRKFGRLVYMLQLPEAHVRGLLECLWDSAYKATEDYIGSSLDVEIACKWTGEKGKLCKALYECGDTDNDGGQYPGFIEPVSDGRSGWMIHNLWVHAPTYVKKAAKNRAKWEEDGTNLSEIRSKAAKARLEGSKRDANGSNLQAICQQKETLPLITSPLITLHSIASPPIASESSNELSPSGKPKVARKSSKFDEPDYSDAMLSVWDKCPPKARIRSSKKEFWEVWEGMKLESRVSELLEALDFMKRTTEWTKDNGNAIPGAHRWLRRKNWEEIIHR